MSPELGHVALILALSLSFFQCIFSLIGAWRNDANLMQSAKPLALAQSLMVVVAFLLLEYAFISNDFSVAYVAQNSNTHLPLFYRMTALWAAHEGSILLWVTILALWTSCVVCFSQNVNAIFLARVLGVMGLVSFGFLLFMLLTSNPFIRLLPPPIDGNDLNPLLQDPGLVVHPPILYMGYVGTVVAFAFAMAALMVGKLDAAWARWSLPWSIASWCFLTVGITLGSWWAYRDLGWGGWWFWDPVENASFMPWLLSTALLHSLIVTEKRGAFKNWTILLAIFAFLLSLMGTFLVRSGILTSVHAFAVDPTRGTFLLVLFGGIMLFSLTLYAFRAPSVGQGGVFDFLSRETMLLANNVFLFVLMATVLLGTLYPLILQVLNIAKISVGPPYFNTVFVPVACLMFLLMPLAPHCRWHHMLVRDLWLRIYPSFFVAVVAAFLLPWLFANSLSIGVVFGLGLALWIMLSTLSVLFERRITHSLLAMVIAHVGVAITIIGITLTSHFSLEKNTILRVGESAVLGKYKISLMLVDTEEGSNYHGLRATFLLQPGSQMMMARKHFYTVSQSVMSLPGIHINPWRDVYIALGDETKDHQGFEVRLYEKPFIRWIWAGALLMALGGVVALWPKRKKWCREEDSKNDSDESSL